MLLKQRISQNVRRWRLARGLTQTELATRCGFERQNVTSIEAEERNIGVDVLENIAIQLQVEPGDLLMDPEQKSVGISRLEYEEKLKSMEAKVRALSEKLESSHKESHALVKELMRAMAELKTHPVSRRGKQRKS